MGGAVKVLGTVWTADSSPWNLSAAARQNTLFQGAAGVVTKDGGLSGIIKAQDEQSSLFLCEECRERRP